MKQDISVVDIDIAKNVFHLVGMDDWGKIISYSPGFSDNAVNPPQLGSPVATRPLSEASDNRFCLPL
ncbi:MAG: hypothetical protein OEU26_19060 [Candidatus Tectomicrobia bacterium]|nr:hypothetical protein [Candidatus Tectomicrobia bacterium]